MGIGVVRVNVRSVAGQSLLFPAAANGHVEVVKLLLGHGIEQNYVDKNGRSPFSVAQLYRRTDVIDILTRYNASTEGVAITIGNGTAEEA